MRQIHQPPGLLLLLLLNREHLVPQLDILDQDIAVDAEEVGEEGLHGFKVLVRGEALREGVEEGVELGEGREGAELEVGG